MARSLRRRAVQPENAVFVRRRVSRVFLRNLGFVLAFVVYFSPEALAAEWIEVRSPHFRVITEEGERSARRVARDLERVRALFTKALPLPISDPLRPVLVFVVEGSDELAALLPVFEDGPRPGGLFRGGQFFNHMVIRLDSGLLRAVVGAHALSDARRRRAC